jgi:hypothetical protein
MSGYNLKLSAIPYHQSSEIRPQHLYITNDEEIKEGDWFMSNLNEILKCTKKEDKFVWYERLTVPRVSKIAQPFSIHINLKPKKIILTTDQDLIKDGVQAIDDDFLEWFVKNPSCEGVETFIFGFDDSIISHSKKYEIIIPKEEPKDVVLGYKTSLNAQMLDKIEPKQETLEEAKIYAVNKWVKGFNHLKLSDFDKNSIAVDFGNGWDKAIKWQQKRMYSEEEVKDLIEDWTKMASGLNQNFPLDKFNIWFEQFKK